MTNQQKENAIYVTSRTLVFLASLWHKVSHEDKAMVEYLQHREGDRLKRLQYGLPQEKKIRIYQGRICFVNN